MGLPTVFLALTDNQRPIAKSLGSAGATLDLGPYTKATPASISRALIPFLMVKKVRAKMAQRSRHLVDGNGALRVVSEIPSEVWS